MKPIRLKKIFSGIRITKVSFSDSVNIGNVTFDAYTTMVQDYWTYYNLGFDFLFETDWNDFPETTLSYRKIEEAPNVSKMITATELKNSGAEDSRNINSNALQQARNAIYQNTKNIK